LKARGLAILRLLRVSLGWLLLLVSLAWAFGALWFDFPIGSGRRPIALLFLISTILAFLLLRPRWRAKLAVIALSGLIAGWWLTLKPDENRAWQRDVSRTAWAEINGDNVTLHNVRNFDYRTESDYTPHWETRSVRLSKLTGFDFAIGYWGSPWMAHPIASFRFADASPLCFSNEVRKVVGQQFSAIASLYRQAQLIYIVADERDVIRVRTNYRHGEDVYLYHVVASPRQVRERFLEYLATLNRLHLYPEWYNVLTTNCTTTIRSQHPASERMPWDWRLLLNGKADEMMYQRRLIATAGLPFTELKRRSWINPQARAANQDPDFSHRIRQDLPTFSNTTR
jgi:hypothetical protein